MKSLKKVAIVAASLSSLVFSDVITGKITALVGGAPVSGATVKLMGGDATAVSDAQGNYSINTSGTSIQEPSRSPWNGRTFTWNQAEGDYTVDVRSFTGRSIEHFDSRGSANRDYTLQLKRNGLYIVSVKTSQGSYSYRVTKLSNKVTDVKSLDFNSTSPKSAARAAAVNGLKFTKFGFMVTIKSIDGPGTLDLTMAKDSNLLSNGNFLGGSRYPGWVVENQDPASSINEVINDGPDSGSGKALKVTILTINPGSTYGFEVQANHATPIYAGKKYSVTYSLKADSTQVMPVTISQAHAPWAHHIAGADWNLTITPKWKTFKYNFTIADTDTLMRLNFGNMAQKVGQSFYIADVFMTSN